jgi:hypothetical protein
MSLNHKNISYEICQAIDSKNINNIVNLDFKEEKVTGSYIDKLK